ncbi:hypothetical protein HYE55_10485 [Aggregatibacter actinomycetemcomitans]|uniref:hypothetical protein n=1 Tax=Aggregatibacter actinomycetemcomitans TaxID=714 RepID=UPI00197C7BDF|nr:hypothetical protein [Aggregatibacter actinomycetemcomitans]MBN6082459.1 hypothetical protein [Aggregatibacter actinomycetemcomitans]
MHYQPDRDAGVVSAQTQAGARHGNEHFRYHPRPQLNHLFTGKSTALYVCYAYAVIGILLFGIGIRPRYRPGSAIHALIYQPRAIL